MMLGGTFGVIAVGFLALMLAYGIYAFRDRRAKMVCALLLAALAVTLLTPGVRTQIFGSVQTFEPTASQAG